MPSDTHLGNWSAGNPRTLLLAADLSARGDRPLERALQLARQWDARLVALHVVERMPPGEDRAALGERARAVLLEEVSGHDQAFEIEVRFGTVGDQVLAMAAEVAADLIVTGVARHNDLGDYVLGTTVDRLVRESAIPILVVKRRVRRDYRKLLAASDYSACSALSLEVLPAFPEAAAALVHAYHVPFEGFIDREANMPDIRDYDRAERDRFVAALSPGIRERLQMVDEYGPVEQVIVRTVREQGFDLAIVGTHGGGGWSRVLIGSTAESLLGVLPCDVLMVPPPR